MSRQRKTRVLRNHLKADPLQRLRQNLQHQDQELIDVLDSLATTYTFDFHRARKIGSDCFEVLLGNRRKTDSSLCQVWARLGGVDSKPAISFFDREQSQDGVRSFPRSASSLLRKASDLQPPFCFLQHDPSNDMPNIREMLCAMILYQALIAGVETSALQWEKFEDSFSQALFRINSSYTYHQWLQEQKLAATSNPHNDDMEQETSESTSHGPAAEEPGTENAINGDSYTGGEVQPGSQMTVRPHTSLAKLRDELSDQKLRLLDRLPPISMTISPHDRGDSYFPFRMLVGSHSYTSGEPIQIYAYLIHDGNKHTTMRFLSHDSADDTTSWTIDDLLQVTLLEPFEYLNNLKKESYGTGTGSSARAAKIRSLISYYFFLAENQGLIGDPLVTTGESFGKRLCAAAKELQAADYIRYNSNSSSGNDDSLDDKANIVAPTHMPTRHTQEAKLALFRRNNDNDGPPTTVDLAVRSETLMDVTKSSPLQNQHESQDDADTSQQQNISHDKLPPKASAIDNIAVSQVEIECSPRVTREGTRPRSSTPASQADRRTTIRVDISDAGVNDTNLSVEGESEDLRTSVPACSDTNNNLPTAITPPESAQMYHHTGGVPGSDHRSSSESEAVPVKSCLSKTLDVQVLDNGPLTPKDSVEREVKAQLTEARAIDKGPEKVIIELSSDNEDVTRPLPVDSKVFQRTPEARHDLIDLMQSSSGPRGMKRRSKTSFRFSDSDNDLLEETDGSAYRQALRRRKR